MKKINNWKLLLLLLIYNCVNLIPQHILICCCVCWVGVCFACVFACVWVMCYTSVIVIILSIKSCIVCCLTHCHDNTFANRLFAFNEQRATVVNQSARVGLMCMFAWCFGASCHWMSWPFVIHTRFGPGRDSSIQSDSVQVFSFIYFFLMQRRRPRCFEWIPTLRDKTSPQITKHTHSTGRVWIQHNHTHTNIHTSTID